MLKNVNMNGNILQRYFLKIKRINNSDTFSQPTLIIFTEGADIFGHDCISYITLPSSQFSPCLLGFKQRWQPTPVNAGSHLQEPFPLMPSKHYEQTQDK